MAVLALAAIPFLVGCGKDGQAKADGGDGASFTPDGAIGPIAGMHAYDVTAVLTASKGPPPGPTNAFTLIVDADARLAIAGGKGRGAKVPLTTTDGRTFRASGGFTVGGDAETCSGVVEMRYDALEVAVTDRALTGTASGTAYISCGDCSIPVAFTAKLTGTTDETPPWLLAFGLVPASPFDSFEVVASEPLPARATARLIADDGAAIDLVPDTIELATPPIVVGFLKPEVVLRAGQGYVVALDGLVDFAGNAERSAPPLRLAAFGDAPLVPEDGFESAVAGTEVGGALVMAGGPLPPIAGNTSVYMGSALGVPRGVAAPVRALSVRLARQAGDTMLRFTYRSVGVAMPPLFSGYLQVGAAGGVPGPAVYSFAAGGPTETVMVGDQPVVVSAASTMTVPLPADVTDEALLVITSSFGECGGVREPPAGLLIDDVTLE